MEETYKKKIIDYIKKNTKKGYPVATLRFALINQGYLRTMVDEAIEQAMKELAKEVPILKDKPQIATEVIAEEEQSVKKKSWLRRLFGL